MAYTSLDSVTGGSSPGRASWANLVGSNLDDHESRIGDLETAETDHESRIAVLETHQVADAHGGSWVRGVAEEEITLSTSGATTDSSANLLPADAVIEAVTARVTQTITTATAWEVGDATTAARFIGSQSALTAGSTVVGLNHQKGSVATDAAGSTQSAAAKVRITAIGGTPGAGKIRLAVYYSAFVAPTS